MTKKRYKNIFLIFIQTYYGIYRHLKLLYISKMEFN